MIVPALLGVAMMAEATQVSGFARTEANPSPAWNPSTPTASWTPTAQAPMTSGVNDRMGRMYRYGGGPQMGRAMQNNATGGRVLVLTGVIAFTDPKQGFAIIGTSVQDTYLARPGQKLPDGSLIREIHANHVVLEHAGNLETVGMYDGSGQPAVMPLHVQVPPLPQLQMAPLLPPQSRVDETEMRGTTAVEGIPTPTRPAPDPSFAPRPRPAQRINEMNEMRALDTPLSDGPTLVPANGAPLNVSPRQMQPEAPLPAGQDPADEFSDDRRSRAENRRK